MLAALLMAFLVGGGGSASGAILTPDTVQQLGKEVRAEVADPERAAAAADTLAELKTEIKSFEKAFAESGKRLTKLYKDHGAGGAAIRAVLDELNAGWESAQQRAIDLRFELRESMTEAEWTAVFGPETNGD